jgi:hypothetical protein
VRVIVLQPASGGKQDFVSRDDGPKDEKNPAK